MFDSELAQATDCHLDKSASLDNILLDRPVELILILLKQQTAIQDKKGETIVFERGKRARRAHHLTAMRTATGIAAILAAVAGSAAHAGTSAGGNVPDAAPADDPATRQSAQDAPPATPAYQADADIVVTAQRRSENLERVPISAQVFGQQALTQQNVTSVISLAQQIPSIHIQPGGRSNLMYVRGTGSGDSQSFDASVGTFVDDIYHGRSRNSAATFLDVEHIELLKGPQTTYFGNNAIAGAINIQTAKPGQKFEGWARALISPNSGENGGQYAVEGAVTIPLNDSLSARFAGTVNGQNGYLRNVVTGQKAPHQNNYAFRGTLRYAPNSDLDVTLKGEIGQIKQTPAVVYFNSLCPAPSPFVSAGFCATNLAAGAPTGLDNGSFSENAGSYLRLKTYEGVLTANYTIGENTLSSVTGYTGYRHTSDIDFDSTSQNLLHIQAPEKYHQFSQELRLASSTGRPIEYLAGLYFQADHLDVEQAVNYFFLSPALAGNPTFAPYLPLGQKIDATQKTRTYSAFASLTWNVTDALKVTGALRESIVTKDFDWALVLGTATAVYGGIVSLPASIIPAANKLGLGTVGTVQLHRRDSGLQPSARVQYQADANVMAYASFSRGFKAGGFSIAELSADPVNYPFQPEHVNAYEAGLKTTLFDRSLTLNLAAFRNDFSDLQVAVQVQTGGVSIVNFIRNAAKSRAQGIELEAKWRVSPFLRLGIDGTYLDSTYLSYPNAGPTIDQQRRGIAIQDLTGKSTPFAPKWSGNVSATVTVPVTDRYRLSAEAIGILSSSFYTFSTIDPYLRQPSYARLDARISLDSTDGRWGIDLIGKNLTNTLIRTLSGPQSRSLGSLLEDRQQFRNIALQVRYRF